MTSALSCALSWYVFPEQPAMLAQLPLILGFASFFAINLYLWSLPISHESLFVLTAPLGSHLFRCLYVVRVADDFGKRQGWWRLKDSRIEFPWSTHSISGTHHHRIGQVGDRRLSPSSILGTGLPPYSILLPTDDLPVRSMPVPRLGRHPLLTVPIFLPIMKGLKWSGLLGFAGVKSADVPLWYGVIFMVNM